MEHTRYIVRKRARFEGMERPVNLPYGTSLAAVDGLLYWEGVRVCAVGSQHALDHFVPDDDGQGKERGDLINAITARLEKRDAEYQARWDKIWADPVSQKYRRKEHADHWLWDASFYAAPVEELRYIARLVGAKEGRKQDETQ